MLPKFSRIKRNQKVQDVTSFLHHSLILSFKRHILSQCPVSGSDMDETAPGFSKLFMEYNKQLGKC